MTDTLRHAPVFRTTVVTTTGRASRSPVLPRRRSSGAPSARPGPLILDYAPSQPHGWGDGTTIGGHIGSHDFRQDGKAYRVSLLPHDPVYEDVPSDPDIDFAQVLDDAFGDHYTFRYVGLRGARKLRVQSYSAYACSDGGVGADLYVVYEPDRRRGDPAIHDDLHWIQVVRSHGPPLDNTARANPFYLTGGLTSIHGNAICTFYDRPDGPTQFMAETFLARDTGVKDGGKEVITILGGLKWGWHVEELSPS